MDFVTPNEISLKFWTSLKTVYNYISKYKSKIRIKKEFWKTFVNLSDFEILFTKNIQSIQWEEIKILKNESNNEVWTLKINIETLQNNYNTLFEQKKNSDNYNLALQEQVSKYALLLNEEKSEKKELMEKYEGLQKEYHSSALQFAKEKLKLTKSFYLLLWITLAIIILFGVFFWKNLFNISKN